MRTNAPRLVTVIAALALTAVGLAFTIYPFQPLIDLVVGIGIHPTREQAWMALLASPALLILGSLLPNL